MTERQIIPEDIRTKLREPFPAEAISQHPTKSFLSTIKAVYILERLNDVFGIGGWKMVTNIINDTPEYVTVSGYIYLYPPYDFATTTQYGGHTKTGKNTEPADGYKSAVTDCQSKCASYLEIGIDVFKGKAGKPKQKPKPPASGYEITDDQKVEIHRLMKAEGMTPEEEKELYAYATEGHGEDKYGLAKDLITNFDQYYNNFVAAKLYETDVK